MIDRNRLTEALRKCPYIRLRRRGITFYQAADWLKARLDPPAVPTEEIIEIDEDGVVHASPETLKQLKGAQLRDPGPAVEPIIVPDLMASEGRQSTTRDQREVVEDVLQADSHACSVETDETLKKFVLQARDALAALEPDAGYKKVPSRWFGTLRAILHGAPDEVIDYVWAALSRSVPGDTET